MSSPSAIEQQTLREVEEIADQYGCDLEEVFSRSRDPQVLMARYHAYWHVWRKFRSLTKAGQFFGGRKGPAITYGVGAHLRRVGQGNHPYARYYMRIRQKDARRAKGRRRDD